MSCADLFDVISAWFEGFGQILAPFSLNCPAITTQMFDLEVLLSAVQQRQSLFPDAVVYSSTARFIQKFERLGSNNTGVLVFFLFCFV